VAQDTSRFSTRESASAISTATVIRTFILSTAVTFMDAVLQRYGLGCVWGDYDNDGFPDLFVTQCDRNFLCHNNGDGTFTDVTANAGVAGTGSGTQFSQRCPIRPVSHHLPQVRWVARSPPLSSGLKKADPSDVGPWR
jgi:hypothetical protein